jgi:hypothetical protein
VLGKDALDPPPRPDDGACAPGGSGDALRHDPHAPSHEDERGARTGQAAHVVDEKIHPRARRVPRSVQPRESVGHGVHGAQQIAREIEASQELPDGSAAEGNERVAERGAHVPLGGLFDRERFGEPRGRHVFAQSSELRLQRFVRAPVALRKES